MCNREKACNKKKETWNGIQRKKMQKNGKETQQKKKHTRESKHKRHKGKMLKCVQESDSASRRHRDSEGMLCSKGGIMTQREEKV